MIRYFAFIFLLFPAAAYTQPKDDIAGRLIGSGVAGPLDLPLLKSDLSVDIQGDMATVQVRQVFINPSDDPMSAEYLFPLNQKAAVYAMQMQVGDEVIEAQIQQKHEAEQTFETAKQEGKAAALLTQHRPNMFTQNVANLMPGQPITVTLSYVQAVPKIDEAYELVLPLIVGPRYQGAVNFDQTSQGVELADFHSEEQVTSTVTEVDGWTVSELPQYPLVPRLTNPDTIEPARVSLNLNLRGAVPVSNLTSATHDLQVQESEGVISASFKHGRVIDNRDLVLRYTLGGDETTAGVLAHHDDRGGFVSVLVEPPKIPQSDQISARELVFVLDTSGSMGGAPLDASKRFMEAALKGLRPEDYFRVIRFSSSASEFASQAVPATRGNIQSGLRYVHSLRAGGGTEIDNAIRHAFATRQPADTLRIVVFLSDGYIGQESRVLRTIRQQIGDARIYAFGVGTAVNRYLLDAMAEEGRGYARYVDPTQHASDVADTLARDLKSPVLTDVSIDWGGLNVTEVVPQHIPDLFDGGSIRVLARYEGGGPADITINGLVQGRKAQMPLSTVLPTESGPESDTHQGTAIPLTWARSKIADLDRAMAVQAGDSRKIEAQITDLGLKFNLQTQFTSFVAVSKMVVNPDDAPADAKPVALPQVASVGPAAYPKTAFSGSSTPEPQTIFGLIMLMALGALRLSRGQRVSA
ncbi:VIT and vWA domain-containing protein [Ruegeria atlantica]|uniref:VIT and vWA domain-containing protein n=1 Tax=Ruegeria atlantica TaxID=81569 RepID=UPI0024955CBA|nr:VIT and VWA domain-containing protein [Ruegeria atlantica]